MVDVKPPALWRTRCLNFPLLNGVIQWLWVVPHLCLGILNQVSALFVIDVLLEVTFHTIFKPALLNSGLHKRTMHLELVILRSIRKGDLLLLLWFGDNFLIFNSGLHKWTMRLELVILLSIRKGDLLLLSAMKLCYSDLATTSDFKLSTEWWINPQSILKFR